jgi:hypothetical protein
MSWDSKKLGQEGVETGRKWRQEGVVKERSWDRKDVEAGGS